MGYPQEPITLHKYAYANLNPVSNIDPSGYSAIRALVLLSAVAIVSAIELHMLYSENIPPSVRQKANIAEAYSLNLVSSIRGTWEFSYDFFFDQITNPYSPEYQTRKRHVRNGWNNIYQKLASGGFVYDYRPDFDGVAAANKDKIGHYLAPRIIIGSDFMKAPVLPRPGSGLWNLNFDYSTVGVFIHEVSHIAHSTKDHEYQNRALELAKVFPAQAVENADNYRLQAATISLGNLSFPPDGILRSI